ncbi:hypothetical protein SE91_28045 [Bradyrhizobium sp. DOA1]|nr:hypothetical protein SE91_28045 [Bradyrhizobium sp. DOA1]
MHRSANKKIIGVLDDDPSALNSIGVLLAALEFEVVLFSSAEELLRSDRARTIDCLLLDIQLGSMSGIDLRRELKGPYPTLPVVFITGLDDQITCQRAHDVGCAGFLRKPFDVALLEETLRRATRV